MNYVKVDSQPNGVVAASAFRRTWSSIIGGLIAGDGIVAIRTFNISYVANTENNSNSPKVFPTCADNWNNDGCQA